MTDQKPATTPKLAYTSPSVKEYGSVSDLVASRGTGALDDGNGQAAYSS
jgi:hypothetical protein